jgi:hypothetical protein
MYNPQNDVGSIKSGFTRNYSQDEVNALKSYIASHSGSLGTLVDRLSGAGIPLQDIAALTKSAGTGAGVAGMAASMPKSPNTGVDMGGGYGGMAPPAYGTAPFHGSGSGLAALAGQVERNPYTQIDTNIGDPIPRMPRDRMIFDPNDGYQNPGSRALTQEDIDQMKIFDDMRNRKYPTPQQPMPTTGGYSGPGGMFPSSEQVMPIGDLGPQDFIVDPDRATQPMPPRAPNDGISDEYYHGDPLGALMGQIQNDRVSRDQPIPIGEAMKRGGAVDISNHPTLVRMALSNRR